MGQVVGASTSGSRGAGQRRTTNAATQHKTPAPNNPSEVIRLITTVSNAPPELRETA